MKPCFIFDEGNPNCLLFCRHLILGLFSMQRITSADRSLIKKEIKVPFNEKAFVQHMKKINSNGWLIFRKLTWYRISFRLKNEC